MKYSVLLAICISVFINSAYAGIKLKPTPLKQLKYSMPLMSGSYDPKITNPDEILGFPVGSRVADSEQISSAIKLWDKQSDRVQAFQYATSHEGRPLYYVLISSPENLNNKEEIKTQLARLANPEGLPKSKANRIIEQLPAVAWMAYSIHGNETSGADAALAAIYHLAASQEKDIQDLLANQIVIVDPMMNPDGRARFAKELQESRGVSPNVDDQSMLHAGSWPYGRTNHYYFDLNRDFILGTQPETRGRVALINQWHPQLMIDGHEMGPQNTYLFAPARDPINSHLPDTRKKWGLKFAEDQAKAFDAFGWRYYTGEWFENLYPGYSSYSEYRGTIHILYEQARIAEDGVRRPEGTIMTYQEAVHHQLVSTITNLKTLQRHSKEMYQDFVAERRENISSDSAYSSRSFVILPTKNRSRLRQFVELMTLQNFVVLETTEEVSASGIDQFGRQLKSLTLPKGTLVIPNRQPEARLVAAMLEFDSAINKEVLIEERQRTLRDGSSLMYDTTAWNLTMMYGLESYQIEQHLTRSVIPITQEIFVETNSLPENNQAVAYAVNGTDDASVGFAARLLEQNLQVRVIDKATELSGHKLDRGSVLITKSDNPNFTESGRLAIDVANELSIKLLPIMSGHGAGDLPDWGGEHFDLLMKPQVALLARGGFNAYDVGATWFSIDSNLGIRHSKLNSLVFNFRDLRRYNVLIMPSLSFSSLSDSSFRLIEVWIKNGGTLIAIDQSARKVIEQELSNVKLLSDAFEDAEEFDLSLQREWLALSDDLDLEAIQSNHLIDDLKYPWDAAVDRLTSKQLKRRDEWQRKFMPSGAMVAARSDQKHWLSFGISDVLPLLYGNNPLLMSDDNSRAVTRIGVLSETAGAFSKLAKAVVGKRRAIGWSTLPSDQKLMVRMSGLLWPEAAQRMANSAHLTRERLGKGQIILFATQPNFRGSTKVTNRMLLNAIVYGPGLGTSTRIEL